MRAANLWYDLLSHTSTKQAPLSLPHIIRWDWTFSRGCGNKCAWLLNPVTSGIKYEFGGTNSNHGLVIFYATRVFNLGGAAMNGVKFTCSLGEEEHVRVARMKGMTWEQPWALGKVLLAAIKTNAEGENLWWLSGSYFCCTQAFQDEIFKDNDGLQAILGKNNRR